MTPSEAAHSPSAADHGAEHPSAIIWFTRGYEKLLMLIAALLPLVAVIYIAYFQDANLLFHQHAVHESLIAIAIMQGAFVAYVSWRCFSASGETLLRWLTLSFLGFTLIYLPHGVLTRLSDLHLALFLVYGPASRLVMSLLLIVGLLSFGKAHIAPEARTRAWIKWTALFLAIDVLLAAIVLGKWIPFSYIRYSADGIALIVFLLGIVLILARRMQAGLREIFIISLSCFAISSFSFLLAKPWNHLWWLAHFIFASGFTVLSFGVIRAFHTTRSFDRVFSQEEIMAQLAASKAYAEQVAQQLQIANDDLAKLAATDPLTGLSNRRRFMELSATEVARAARTGEPCSILVLDLDHFKHINDTYGHSVGDEVLQAFARTTTAHLRPFDLICRWGGEEFMILMPDTSGEATRNVAERIRQAVEQIDNLPSGTAADLSVSIGIAEFPQDSEDREQLFNIADRRMYLAKERGRNRFVDAASEQGTA